MVGLRLQRGIAHAANKTLIGCAKYCTASSISIRIHSVLFPPTSAPSTKPGRLSPRYQIYDAFGRAILLA